MDDAAVDGNQVTSITVAIDDANSDDGYDAVENQTVSVTTTDDDTAGYTIQEMTDQRKLTSPEQPTRSQ